MCGVQVSETCCGHGRLKVGPKERGHCAWWMTATMEPPSGFCCLCCMFCVFRACSAHAIVILSVPSTDCVHSVLCSSIEVQTSSLRLVRCSGFFEVLECYWCMRTMSRYFDYLFYVDFEASMADHRAQNAMGHLQVYYGTYFPRNSISSWTYAWNHVIELAFLGLEVMSI